MGYSLVDHSFLDSIPLFTTWFFDITIAVRNQDVYSTATHTVPHELVYVPLSSYNIDWF